MAIQDLTASLDLKQNLNIYIMCKQFDTLNLILSIFDNSIQADLTGYTVRLRAMKADQIPLIQEYTDIDAEGNIVTIEADEQLTTTAGDTLIELQFIDSTGKKKATFNLVLRVIPSAIAVSASISTATYTLLEELENKLDQLTDFYSNIEEATNLNESLQTQNSSATSNISSLNIQNTNATQNISDLESQNNSASTNIPSLTSLNTQAEANIAAMESFGDVTVLVQTVNKHTTQLEHIATDVKNFGAKGDGTTNDTVAFQNALLNLVNGGTLLIPQGIYLIQDILYIPSNTKIIGVGQVVLKRNSDTNALMITKSDGTISGYDACSNITIENITFDGAQSNFQSNCTLFSSGHAKNIKVYKCTFKNLDGWHMVELNSTEDSIISECIFDNYGYGNNGATATEMLQLDYAGSSAAFPWYGPYDNTHCKNITIKDNVFTNSISKAIGNHSFLTGSILKNINIINNVFDNIKDISITLADLDGLYILDNKFLNPATGIWIQPQQNPNYNIVIRNNKYEGDRLTETNMLDHRFLNIDWAGTMAKETANVEIVGNEVINSLSHGIGMTANDVIIKNNIIRGCNKNGIYAYGGANYVIEGNLVIENNQQVDSNRGDIVLGNNSNKAILTSIMSGNRIKELRYGSNVTNILVQNNVIEVLTNTSNLGTNKNNLINNVWTA